MGLRSYAVLLEARSPRMCQHLARGKDSGPALPPARGPLPPTQCTALYVPGTHSPAVLVLYSAC